MLEEIKDKTKAFISRYFPKFDAADDDDIFALGFINSLFAMQLVMFVEKEFHITVEDGDLNIENFRTVSAVANLVRRRTVQDPASTRVQPMTVPCPNEGE